MSAISKEDIKKFSYAIDSLVAKKEISYVDAILYYCESTGLEIGVAATLITDTLKSKIESEAIENKLLKTKINKLPI
jgi:hypothetical protein